MKYGVYLFFIGLLVSFSGYGQPAELLMAENYLKSGDFENAKLSIDKASAHEITSRKAKVWKLKGDIYSAYYAEKDGGLKSLEQLDEIFEYYTKAKELDTKKIHTKDLNQQWVLSQNAYLNRGVEEFNKKNFKDSYNLFLLTLKCAEFVGVTDSLAMYNAGLAAEKSGNNADAIEWYDKCEALGYRGVNCCSFSVYLHRISGDAEKMKQRLAACRAKYPTDQNLLITDINGALMDGRLQDVVGMVDEAIAADPGNYVLHYTQGTAYDGLGKIEKAEEKYLKAVELNPNYFDALYNLGALFFNLGVEANNEMSDETDPERYLKMKEKTDGLFAKSLPHLEKASSLKPNDLNTLNSLKQLYARMGDEAKYSEVNARIKAIQGN